MDSVAEAAIKTCQHAVNANFIPASNLWKMVKVLCIIKYELKESRAIMHGSI